MNSYVKYNPSENLLTTPCPYSDQIKVKTMVCSSYCRNECKYFIKEQGNSEIECSFDPFNKKEPERKTKRNKIKDVLSSHGIKMSVQGCGCCGSPRVVFEYEGETINEDEFSFDMFVDRTADDDDEEGDDFEDGN